MKHESAHVRTQHPDLECAPSYRVREILGEVLARFDELAGMQYSLNYHLRPAGFEV